MSPELAHSKEATALPVSALTLESGERVKKNKAKVKPLTLLFPPSSPPTEH